MFVFLRARGPAEKYFVYPSVHVKKKKAFLIIKLLFIWTTRILKFKRGILANYWSKGDADFYGMNDVKIKQSAFG